MHKFSTLLFSRQFFHCPFCPDGHFDRKWKLNRHTNSKHPNDKNKLICQYCNKSFKFVQTKQKHELSCPKLKEQLWKPNIVVGQNNNNEFEDKNDSNFKFRHEYRVSEIVDDDSKSILVELKKFLNNQGIGVEPLSTFDFTRKKFGKLSEKTISSYCSNVKQFFCWMNVCFLQEM